MNNILLWWIKNCHRARCILSYLYLSISISYLHIVNNGSKPFLFVVQLILFLSNQIPFGSKQLTFWLKFECSMANQFSANINTTFLVLTSEKLMMRKEFKWKLDFAVRLRRRYIPNCKKTCTTENIGSVQRMWSTFLYS